MFKFWWDRHSQLVPTKLLFTRPITLWSLLESPKSRVTPGLSDEMSRSPSYRSLVIRLAAVASPGKNQTKKCADKGHWE